MLKRSDPVESSLLAISTKVPKTVKPLEGDPAVPNVPVPQSFKSLWAMAPDTREQRQTILTMPCLNP